MTTQQENDAYNSLIEWEKEIQDHNENILRSIKHDPRNFKFLLDEGCTTITDKMEWVEEPDFEPEYSPDVYGVFTLTHVDQWSVGLEGDSFEGFMYVKVEGHEKWLKIPYSC